MLRIHTTVLLHQVHTHGGWTWDVTEHLQVYKLTGGGRGRRVTTTQRSRLLHNDKTCKTKQKKWCRDNLDSLKTSSSSELQQPRLYLVLFVAFSTQMNLLCLTQHDETGRERGRWRRGGQGDDVIRHITQGGGAIIYLLPITLSGRTI